MIKKYVCTADNVITDAYQSNNNYRATSSNQGNSDTLQVFMTFGQQSSNSRERSRILLKFPTDQIALDRSLGKIPASGSVNFSVKLFNAPHPFSLPRNYYLCLSALSGALFDEGISNDSDEFSQDGVSNWMTCNSSSTGIAYWQNQGGDFYHGNYIPNSTFPSYTSSIQTLGTEDLELQCTSLVEEYLTNNKPDYGMALYLHPTNENAISSSYYVKKYFSRSSEFRLQLPVLEAQFDDSKFDHRGNFFASSSLCDVENLNTIFLTNRIRGSLKTIPGTASGIYVRVYDDASSGSLLTPTVITGGLVSTGVYSASFALATTSSVVYDRWLDSTLTQCYFTGAINISNFSSQGDSQEEQFIISMPGLKSSYTPTETARFKVFCRNKSWSPNLYAVAVQDQSFELSGDLYYQVRRVVDKFIVTDFLTGSNSIPPATRLSRDISGSYFNYDMANLMPDFAYEINFLHKRPDGINYEELPYSFKFMVERETI